MYKYEEFYILIFYRCFTCIFNLHCTALSFRVYSNIRKVNVKLAGHFFNTACLMFKSNKIVKLMFQTRKIWLEK